MCNLWLTLPFCILPLLLLPARNNSDFDNELDLAEFTNIFMYPQDAPRPKTCCDEGGSCNKCWQSMCCEFIRYPIGCVWKCISDIISQIPILTIASVGGTCELPCFPAGPAPFPILPASPPAPPGVV